MPQDSWTRHFPELNRLPTDILDTLKGSSQVKRFSAGTQLFGPGKSPDHYLLLIAGTFRVQQVSESGREIVLYRVSSGESCALTTACLMGYQGYLAEAIVEEDSEVVAIPRSTFDKLIADSEVFRQFVFMAFSNRVTNLLRIIDEVAFARIDIRLAERLLDRAKGRRELHITHQQLAAELGSAREVISRQLKEFQRRGWLSQSRGNILLENIDALSQLANDH